MDAPTNQTNPPSFIQSAMAGYQRLGRKTFVVFLMDRIQVAALFLLLAAGLFIVSSQPFLAKIAIPNLASYVTLAAWGALGLFVITLVIAFLVSWIIYANYTFFLDEDSLRIKRGVITKEEIAIPYRQIQDVDIERDITYQMLGMSRLVILTAGHEDEPEDQPKNKGEAEGILPAIDKDEAEQLQQELLKRTNVEKVIEQKS
jgi:uncharacterized membrane protein YdbT with pleckstrin-like domain